jgi:phosphonate transport system substrate-binding protein
VAEAAPLRFVTLLAPRLEPVYDAVARAVAAGLGRTAHLETGTDPQALVADGFDVAFVCSPPYLWLADRDQPLAEAVAAPVLRGERYGGAPVYFSDLIVARHAPFASFGDLRGASCAYNEPWSWSGRDVLMHRLARAGEDGAFFSRIVESGFHQRSLRMVAGGSIDCAAIDSQVLAMELRDHPGLADRIRVIEALGPSTIQPVIASTALSESARSQLRAAFADLDPQAPGLREHLAFGLIERWTAMTDADYDAMRARERDIETLGEQGFGVRPGTRTP